MVLASRSTCPPWLREAWRAAGDGMRASNSASTVRKRDEAAWVLRPRSHTHAAATAPTTPEDHKRP